MIFVKLAPLPHAGDGAFSLVFSCYCLFWQSRPVAIRINTILGRYWKTAALIALSAALAILHSRPVC
jgi:hypothetical protein